MEYTRVLKVLANLPIKIILSKSYLKKEKIDLVDLSERRAVR